MREINIKSQDMFPLIVELLNNGQSARIVVRGSSMYPFLRENIDSVELTKTDFNNLRVGDIVMIRRNSGVYVMHRILKKEEKCFYMVGDAQQWIEGPLSSENLIAKVTAIWRKEKKILCSNKVWKLLSRIWLMLRPCRDILINNYERLFNLKRKIKMWIK